MKHAGLICGLCGLCCIADALIFQKFRGWSKRRSLGNSSKQSRATCLAQHPALLQTIKAELAMLPQRGVNASSLDKVFWPRHRLTKGEDSEDMDTDQSFNTSWRFQFVQIHDGKLYLDSQRGKGKCLGPHSFDIVNDICKTLEQYPDLPSMRFMVSSQEDDTSKYDDIPVFVPWKVKGSLPINWPYVRKGESWPQTAWVDKSSQAFFSGNPSDDDNPFPSSRHKRRELQRLFETDPESQMLMNISVSTDDRNFEHHHFYEREEEEKFKYLIELDGHAARNSYADHLAMNSLVFKEVSPYYSWFEPALKAYKHFVPVNLTDLADSSAPGHDLKTKISWARKYDDSAKEIAEAGTTFDRNHLNDGGVRCYIAELLLQYQELMQFDDQLPPMFASSPDVCKLIEAERPCALLISIAE